MIYIAVQLIQIFSAHGSTDHGGTRGPRGPKKRNIISENRVGVGVGVRGRLEVFLKFIEFGSSGHPYGKGQAG